MKIVGIISSPKRNGSGAFLVRKALEASEKLGVETKEIFLADYIIEFCKGCFHCMASGTCTS